MSNEHIGWKHLWQLYLLTVICWISFAVCLLFRLSALITSFFVFFGLMYTAITAITFVVLMVKGPFG